MLHSWNYTRYFPALVTRLKLFSVQHGPVYLQCQWVLLLSQKQEQHKLKKQNKTRFPIWPCWEIKQVVVWLRINSSSVTMGLVKSAASYNDWIIKSLQGVFTACWVTPVTQQWGFEVLSLTSLPLLLFSYKILSFSATNMSTVNVQSTEISKKIHTSNWLL